MAGRIDLDEIERALDVLGLGGIREDDARFMLDELRTARDIIASYRQFALQAHPPHHDIEGCHRCGLISRAERRRQRGIGP